MGPAEAQRGALMLLVTVAVAAPAGQAIGIKEDLAMFLEKFGATMVPDIQNVPPEQLSAGGKMLVISVTVDAPAVRAAEIKRDLSKHLS